MNLQFIFGLIVLADALLMKFCYDLWGTYNFITDQLALGIVLIVFLTLYCSVVVFSHIAWTILKVLAAFWHAFKPTKKVNHG